MSRWVRAAATLTVLALLCVLAGVASASLLRNAELRVAAPNTRGSAVAIGAPRGDVVTADGHLVATTPAGDLARTYPTGDLYADVVGFISAAAGAAGLELTYGPELSGTAASLRYAEPVDLLRDNEALGHLGLTLRHDLQLAATSALADALVNLSSPARAHAVLVDIATSNVLALTSTDRAPVDELARAHDERARHEAVDLYWSLRADPTQPLLASPHERAYLWHIIEPGAPAVAADALNAWSGHVGTPLGEPPDRAPAQLSAASVAAVVASVITGRQPLNLRVVDAIYTTSPAGQLAVRNNGPLEPTPHETIPRTIARTLRERGGSPTPNAAPSAQRAALAAVLSEPGPPAWPTTTPASWLTGTVSSTARGSSGHFAVAVAPVNAPQFVAVVVAEPQPGATSASSSQPALGTVTVSVAAALLDAAFGRSDR